MSGGSIPGLSLDLCSPWDQAISSPSGGKDGWLLATRLARHCSTHILGSSDAGQ